MSEPRPDLALVVWQIEASKGYFEGSRVGGLRLLYGKVPSGYAQVIPNRPEQPAPLSTGVIYSFFAETSGAPTASGYFYMDTSGPIPVSAPDLCLARTNGNETKVRCGTSEPYEEPTDIEKFVREHRMSE